MSPLRQRFIDDLRIRNLSPKTIEAYVAGVVRFAHHFGRSPSRNGWFTPSDRSADRRRC